MEDNKEKMTEEEVVAEEVISPKRRPQLRLTEGTALIKRRIKAFLPRKNQAVRRRS